MNEEKIPRNQTAFILGAIGFISLRIGRWYNQWYYGEFNIQYQFLDLSQFEYAWSSWTTWLSTISVLYIFLLFWSLSKVEDRSHDKGPIYNYFKRFILLFYLSNVKEIFHDKGTIYHLFIKVFALLFGFIVVCLFTPWWYWKFSPDADFIYKILGSKDIMLWVYGVTAFFLFNHLLKRCSYTSKKSNINKNSNITTVPAIDYSIGYVLMFTKTLNGRITYALLLAILMSVIALWQAKDQANAAITTGKMGLQTASFKNEPKKKYYFIPLGKLYFLYDPKKESSMIVSDIRKLDVDKYIKIQK